MLIYGVPLFLLYFIYAYLTEMFFAVVGICIFIYYAFYFICWLFFDTDVTLAFAAKFGKPIRSLKGKVVFITGASSGIGEFTAVALAQNGVKLVLAARRREELERVKADCLVKSQGQLSSNDVLVIPMDVLKVELHQKYFEDALHHFGQIDIVLNNAGRSQRANWENIDLKVDRELFDLNVFGVLSFSRIAVKYFQSRNGGHIAVTSSLAGIIGAPFSGSYTGSKHAIHGYFNSLRSEKMFENDLAVTLLCPGPTFTNFLAHSFTENAGQVYGINTSTTDRRMTGERCGYLCAVALANRLSESWMGIFPIIPAIYLAVYSPITYSMIIKLIGPKWLNKFRDSKDVIVLPSTASP